MDTVTLIILAIVVLFIGAAVGIHILAAMFSVEAL